MTPVERLDRLDVLLCRKPAWWEHPRNFAIILGVLAAIFSALGYMIGSAPPQPIIIHLSIDRDC